MMIMILIPSLIDIRQEGNNLAPKLNSMNNNDDDEDGDDDDDDEDDVDDDYMIR